MPTKTQQLDPVPVDLTELPPPAPKVTARLSLVIEWTEDMVQPNADDLRAILDKAGEYGHIKSADLWTIPVVRSVL